MHTSQTPLLANICRPLSLLSFGLTLLAAGEPELVIDGNLQRGGVQVLTAGGTQAVFTTITPDQGHEVWVSDGTLVGTRLLRDIAPGRANASPRLGSTIAGRTWFSADSGQTGSEPWLTDGTGGGTVPLGDLCSGNDAFGQPKGSDPNAFTDIGNGTVLFLAYTTTGATLFRSDGTLTGTTALRVLSTAPPSNAFPIAAYSGARLAGADAAVFCIDGKVFRSDGTSAGTTELIMPGGAVAPIKVVSGCGGAFLVGYNAEKFYFTDGTNVRLLDPGGRVGANLVLPTTAVGNRLVFTGGGRLLSTDGTQAGMQVLDTTDTSRHITVAGGTYWVDSGGGSQPSQLRRTDGTVAGTVLVSASGIYFEDVPCFVTIGSNTWFIGSQAINGELNRQVYRFDGTTTVRFQVWAGVYGTGLTFDATMVAQGQRLIIKDSGTLLGFDTVTGLTTVLAAPSASYQSSTPIYLHPFKDGFLYWADDVSVNGGQRSIKPWFYRPDSGQVPLTLSFIRPTRLSGGETTVPLADPFFSMGSFALFGANNSQSPFGPGREGMELWKTDGTSAGTGLLKDLWPGSMSGFSSVFGLVPGSTTTAIIAGNLPTAFGDIELMLTDGTASGTIPLKDINPGNASSAPFNPTDMGSYWLFNATTNANGRELWRTDGTAVGTTLVKDINPGSGDSINPYNAPVAWTRIGTTAFFTATDGSNGQELWKTDGTAAGTVMVKDINPGAASSSPLDLCALNGTLYFVATSAASGRELWVSDGTVTGTTMVKDIIPGSASSVTSPNWGYGFLTVSNGRLWFVADDGVHGRELWSSDGTAAGTAMFKDIDPGAAGSDPYALIDVAGVLCFVANDGTTGHELWQTDGTQANTFLAGDINTGPASSNPFYRDISDSTNYQVIPDAVVRNGTVFFSARAASVGRELWRYTPARTTGAAGTIGFSSAAVTVSEAAGNAVITLVRSGGEGATTVNVQTVAGGSATAGSDYVATSGQVTFLTGETTKTVIIPIINDGVVESAETVLLTITNPTGGALLGQATATLTISDGGAANQAPVATAQTVSTPKNTPRSITLAGTDPDGQAVTVAGVSAPTSGTLTGSGSVRTFTPATNATGTVTFTFTVTDGIAVSTPATVTITVTDTVNLAPTATAQSVTTPVNTAIAITLTGTDPEGSGLLLNSTTSPAHGQLTGSGQGLSRTFVPASGFTGQDSFTFTVSDGVLTSAPATVTITVGGTNTMPVVTVPAQAQSAVVVLP